MCRNTRAVTTNAWTARATRAASRASRCRCRRASWGIADIFEALTARDRPYKPGMKLSQAMSILANFRRNQHIDPDLFEVFVREKVYREYAEKFLEPHQIDDVDEASLLQ